MSDFCRWFLSLLLLPLRHLDVPAVDRQRSVRQVTLREIYPAELGCPNDRRSGMHWTPIAGTTLLHLSIDFAEKEIFDWLLAHGADVNARAMIDADGFGGQPNYGASARQKVIPVGIGSETV